RCSCDVTGSRETNPFLLPEWKAKVRSAPLEREKKAERRRSRDMQSCSIHHCVLLLLTLTFTTAPVADADCPTLAKLHQRVTLPCKHKCSGETKWTLYDTRDVVFARCDQTSCSSVVKGYEMSHDQYKKGDFSLTITSAEYSMRNTYVCECRSSDYSTVRLSIETVFSAVQVKHDGDLILDLSVPEPVEVIYTSSDSAVGEQICNVTQHSLQCKAEYTHRTSLSYPELTLRDVTYSDSGRYTIRDTENKEDIRVYAVSVTGLTKGMTALIVLLVLVVVLVISGVIIYKWREAEKKRRAAEEKCRAAEEKCRAAEENCRAAEENCRAEEERRAAVEKRRAAVEKWRAAVEKWRAAVEEWRKTVKKLRAAEEELRPFVNERRVAEEKRRVAEEERRVAEEERRVAEEERRVAEEERREVENEMKAVCGKISELLLFVRDNNPRDQIEKMIEGLEQWYRENRKYSDHVTLFCNQKRTEEEFWKSFYGKTQEDSESEQVCGLSTELLKTVMQIKESQCL
ncbi:hypothetical protein AMELA_G00243540, partial [Ameiurus melas]